MVLWPRRQPKDIRSKASFEFSKRLVHTGPECRVSYATEFFKFFYHRPQSYKWFLAPQFGLYNCGKLGIVQIKI